MTPGEFSDVDLGYIEHETGEETIVMTYNDMNPEEEKDFYGNLQTPYTLITRKPIVPTDEENENNSRARSAKLRIAERK